ncbi:MAG TPA: hypothetical protein VJ787_13010 [Thermoleophilia bacterium]|nr:hypothetical protein [Thermoleophilia bacterium]
MQTTISLTFTHGAFTCAETPGVFCAFLRVDMMGQSSCAFAKLLGGDAALYERDGWVMRSVQCLDSSWKQMDQ